MPSQKQIRQEITQRIIEALEQGVKPWRRPWSVSPNSGRPMNIMSRKVYQGINPLAARTTLPSLWLPLEVVGNIPSVVQLGLHGEKTS